MSDPRRLAAEVLVRVDTTDAYANLLLPPLLGRTGMEPRDANLTTELVYGTLRWLRLLDAVLNAAGGRDPQDLDPAVRAILRIGAHELLHLRVPAHAAVDTAVRAAKAGPARAASGLINAVLRRVARRSEEEWLDVLGRDMDAETFRGVRWSHPGWIVRALGTALARDGRKADLEALLAADNSAPAVHLVALPGAAERDPELASAYSPYGMIAPVGRAHTELERPGIRAQDEGSQLAALALAAAVPPRSGERWLDVCAGPGGKTALLAAVAPSGTSVIANEPVAHRAELVRRATARFRVPVRELDGADFLGQEGAAADRILLDAPCTGLGALRRRPEARWRKRPADVRRLARLQSRLLDAAAAALRPGAVLCFTTCSPHLDETTARIDEVLARHPELERLDTAAVLRRVSPQLETGANPAGVQLWPHMHGTDAMFISLLRRLPSAAAPIG